ncbi:MAG: WecB/TagA/CpsF family glycosyltransferase [Planctomycetaceae bacterium]|nr:WecB/TagA/CpsF family glycosyltransferase [Planctomycetaceae bacterium]
MPTALQENTVSEPSVPSPPDDSVSHDFGQTRVWGVPFTPVTYGQSIDLIDQQARSSQPGYFITANMQYVMMTDRHPELQQVNADAKFIIADGMPIVWRSRTMSTPLPERVAGSDQIYSIAELAARRGYRIFFLGGESGVAQETADILQQKNAGLQVVGVESPPFRQLTDDEEIELADRIRIARPDILLVALGQPKGELWIHRWYKKLGVPLSVQLGGSFNFVTGRISRSPKWIARIGMEWLYRFYREPRRLGPRYAANWLFLAKAVIRDATRRW